MSMKCRWSTAKGASLFTDAEAAELDPVTIGAGPEQD